MSAETIAEWQKKAIRNQKWCECDQRKHNEKRKEKGIKTRQIRRGSTAHTDDCEDDSSSGRPSKKAKHDSVQQRVTTYMHIQPTALRQPSSSRGKAKTQAPVCSILGPCFFNLEQSYKEFRVILAKALPCKLALLPSSQVTWKYEKPANDPKKPLSNTQGYEDMVISLSERKAGHVIQVFMPPPKANDVVSYYACLYHILFILLDMGHR